MKKQQKDFLDWEFGVFFHFGIRTFNEGHRDWDLKPMALSSFNPPELDCEEWIRAVRDAGAAYAILVTKHHDGFANWPSAYTEYSVKNTPWKDGKGDVVREFVDACRKYGIKVGLYYSPAQFGGAECTPEEYDDYFINQVKELLLNYGTIDYLWFDGNGSHNMRYNTARIIGEIRKCQPNILIFNMWDPDTRWVGNESGVAHSPNKLTVGSLDVCINNDIKDLLDPPRCLPVECDCRMRQHNWFYSDRDVQTVKSLDELMGLYYYSVGRGANLLLNIGPDRRGKLPPEDKAALLRFGEKIREVFSDFIPCEQTQEGQTLTLDMEAQLINQVILAEEPDPNCEIGHFEIRAYPYEYGPPVTVFHGTSIGHKTICMFPTLKTCRVDVIFDQPKKVTAKVQYRPMFL